MSRSFILLAIVFGALAPASPAAAQGAASGVHGLSKMLEYHRTHAPLRRTTDQDEVGDAALFLLSPMSRGVTGEVIHVDGGFHVMGMAAL